MDIISKREPPKATKESVLMLVKQIPPGKVVTYGMVANQLGFITRTVGWIMASLSEFDMMSVPWHRVVGAGGTIPALKYGFRGEEQIRRLMEEGIECTGSKLTLNSDSYYIFNRNN